MYKLSCKKCGCDRVFKNKKSIEKALRLKRELCSKCSTKYVEIKWRPFEEAMKFYREEVNRQNLPLHKIDSSNFPSDIPKDPFTVYRKFGFKHSMLKVEWVPIEVAIVFYKSEVERQGIKSFNKIDRSGWPTNIPKSPATTYKNFAWSMVTEKTINREWASLEDAILFYRSEIERQGTQNYTSLEKNDWPLNIPKSPMKEYDGFRWSDVTGYVRGADITKIRRLEIARLIVSYGDMIDNFDDTLIAMLLSQLVEKINVSKLVARKVKKLIMTVVENNEQGERKQKLEELANEISETDSHSEMFDVIDSLDNDDNEEQDDFDELDDTTEAIENPVLLSKEKIKAKSKAMAQAALNDDFTADFKELMRKNALKYMWYLEFMS